MGLSGILQRRWRGVVRFLEAYAQGEQAELKDRPTAITEPQFIRYCVDDLKAFYYEARMTQNLRLLTRSCMPGSGAKRRWDDCPAARRLNASDDPTLKAIAYGIAR